MFSNSWMAKASTLLFTALLVSPSGWAKRPDGGNPPPSPIVALEADRAEIEVGEQARLSWASTHAKHCTASGQWDGRKPTSGTYASAVLLEAGVYQFHLTCSTKSERTSVTAQVAVREPLPPEPEPEPDPDPDPEPAPMPDVTLSASPNAIVAGESTTVQWSAQNAEWCNASGAWNGSKAMSGSVEIGNLTQTSTFEITCGAAENQAIALATVNVAKLLNLQWSAPTQNTDGSPVGELAGYNLYLGETSGDYTLHQAIENGAIHTAQLQLPPGDYYFALTAINAEGIESEYSAEVFSQVQ